MLHLCKSWGGDFAHVFETILKEHSINSRCSLDHKLFSYYQVRDGHELKKQKKIRSPQTPYWEAPAKHTIPHFILIGGVWSVICWFGIGVVSKCLSSFGRYIPSPTYCGARDETSCLMCTVWAAGDAGFSTAPSAQKPKKIKKIKAEVVGKKFKHYP